MLELILMMTLFPQQPQAIAQIQPCVWPNRCAEAPAPVQTVAQFQPCVWPNRCAETPAPVVSGPIGTCDYPNKCS